MKRILSVKVKREMDMQPDLSWLGEYHGRNNLILPHTIDREERGDKGRGEFRYFTAGNSPEETGNPESVEQDYQRMEDYNRQGWCMMGVFAEAEVVLTDVAQTIHSGGLWEIESDSGEEYFTEVEETELDGLRIQLKEIGFTKRQIDAAFAKKESVQA